MTPRDVLIIGGGIVGLATAWRLVERGRSVVVVEKEDRVALHQSGRNSGVLHSGVYYAPGSRKARLCREGRAAMVRFCAEHGIAHDVCGKVIVAASESEVPRLRTIHERGTANGVACPVVGPERLREIEPHAAGVAALHVADAGIVDFPAVCVRLAAIVEERGGHVVTNARVLGIETGANGVTARTTAGDMHARTLVNAAGLHADRIAIMAGRTPAVRIVPFRGAYAEVVPPSRDLCRHLVYPVPDPAYPFLGVHATRCLDGRVECGPSAVLALAREGYTRGAISPRDLVELLAFPGFRRLAKRHWRTAAGELRRSASRHAFARALQRLLPDVRTADLRPAPAGVRAQAVDAGGNLVDDFVIEHGERAVHVLNAPSPAATASLAIGAVIADEVVKALAG